MVLKFAIIADDLTGALDSSTPFALAGLKVSVATHHDGTEAMLATLPDVAVVNTASRAVPADEAASRVASASALLRQGRPQIAFKKIDSRLKGNVHAEVEAMRHAFGYEAVIVAPAVPDQDRYTAAGAVIGRGIDGPLPVAPLFAPGTVVADASSELDLDAIVAGRDWSGTLAVGARGLGQALARSCGSPRSPDFLPKSDVLIACGSQDVITLEQIARLIETRPQLARCEAPQGELATLPSHLPALIRATGVPADAETVARRLAEGVVRALDALKPGTLVMSGGDTALAVLDALGTNVVFPMGESAPGLPWFLIELPDASTIRCVVKSGGFGGTDALAVLLPPEK